MPFLLSSHFCLSAGRAPFSPADRFSLHDEEYGHCQLITSTERMPLPSSSGGGALTVLAWATCVLGAVAVFGELGAMTDPAGIAGPALWPGGRGGLLEEGSVLGTQSYGYHPCCLDQPLGVSYPVKGLGTPVLCAQLPALPPPELAIWWRKQTPNRPLQCRV